MRIAQINPYISKIYSPAPSLKRFGLVQDTVSFGAKKDPKVEIKSIMDQKNVLPPHISTPIILNTNEDNLELAKIMVKDETCPVFLISNILSTTNKDNVDSRIEGYKILKGQKGKLKKDYPYALSSLIYTEPNNVDILKMMAVRKHFPKRIMWSVLIPVNEENKDMAEMMIKDPEFPKERIAGILFTINDKNKEVARALIEKKDFPREDIGLVLSNVTPLNSQFCLYMISDDSYGTSKIVDTLKELSI